MSCSVKEDLTHSAIVEVYGFAFKESCSTATGLAICSIVCFAVGCSDCSSLMRVGVTRVWIDDAEILLKIFVWRFRRPCSSSESSSSIIATREEVGLADCVGTTG